MDSKTSATDSSKVLESPDKSCTLIKPSDGMMSDGILFQDADGNNFYWHMLS
jgi:hypothetical protein